MRVNFVLIIYEFSLKKLFKYFVKPDEIIEEEDDKNEESFEEDIVREEDYALMMKKSRKFN